MPHLEVPVESSLSPPADPLVAFLPWPELREVLRKTAQIEEVSSALGWPRAWDPALIQRRFCGPHLVCTLAHANDLDAGLTWLTLPVDQAVALADLCLGGSGIPSVACRAGTPSDAECGVLAYLAARCVRVCAPALRLRDVDARPASALVDWPADSWLWPLRVTVGGVTLDLTLLSHNASALSLRPVSAQLCVADDLEPAAMTGLAPGDLLVCEASPVQYTHAGLSGTLQLVAAELQASLCVALEAGQIRALHTPPGTAHRTRARVVLAEAQANMLSLAQLASGQRPLTVTQAVPARIELDGAPLASGKLVRHGGALGLEVEALSSMR